MSMPISGGIVRRPLLTPAAWWLVALSSAVVCGFLTLQSIRLATTVVLVGTVVGIHLRSRTAGLISVWLVWLLVPFVRRLMGLSLGFESADPMAVAPFAVTGAVAFIEFRRAELSQRAKLVLYLAFGGLAFGVPAGLVLVPQAAVFAIGAYGASVLFFVAGYREPQDRELSLALVLAAIAAPLGAYAIAQSLVPLPAWDQVWLDSADFVSAGNQEEGTLRPWATLNSPGTLATILGIATIFLLARRRFGLTETSLLMLVLAGLTVTLVRGVWGALALALILLVIVAPSRIGRRVALVGIAAVLVFPFAGGGTPTADNVTERATTFGELGTDNSAQARIATPSVLIPLAVQQPLGLGLGSAGEASRLVGGGLRATDNAVLSLIFQLGPVGLCLILAAIGLGVASAVRTVKRHRATRHLAVLGCLVLLCGLMVFGDVFYGVAGVALWYLVGAAVRADEATKLRTT
jgi:hypothetical protein